MQDGVKLKVLHFCDVFLAGSFGVLVFFDQGYITDDLHARRPKVILILTEGWWRYSTKETWPSSVGYRLL